MTRAVFIGALGAVVAVGAAALLLGGLLLVGAGAPPGPCERDVDARVVPAELVPLFRDAARNYDLGPEGAAVLAGLTSVESDFGRHLGPSSAGAIGWAQFM